MAGVVVVSIEIACCVLVAWRMSVRFSFEGGWENQTQNESKLYRQNIPPTSETASFDLQKTPDCIMNFRHEERHFSSKRNEKESQHFFRSFCVCVVFCLWFHCSIFQFHCSI